MKKHTTAKKDQELSKTQAKIREMATKQRLTIGLDLGDRLSRYCVLDAAGEVVSEGKVPTTKTGLDSLFEKMPSSRVALEVGTHSPWVNRHLGSMGHEMIVANPHKVKPITQAVRKNDRIDARQLARLARVDPKLLSPIRHRGEQAQADLAVIRARAELVEARTGRFAHSRDVGPFLGLQPKQRDSGDSQPQTGDQQNRRSIDAHSAGAGGAWHFTERGTGQRSASVGREQDGEWQERQAQAPSESWEWRGN